MMYFLTFNGFIILGILNLQLLHMSVHWVEFGVEIIVHLIYSGIACFPEFINI